MCPGRPRKVGWRRHHDHHVGSLTSSSSSSRSRSTAEEQREVTFVAERVSFGSDLKHSRTFDIVI